MTSVTQVRTFAFISIELEVIKFLCRRPEEAQRLSITDLCKFSNLQINNLHHLMNIFPVHVCLLIGNMSAAEDPHPSFLAGPA